MKLVLHIDKGLAAWIDATVKGFGIYGGRKQTAVALLRNGLLSLTASQNIREMIVPHLPEPFRTANMHKPKKGHEP